MAEQRIINTPTAEDYTNDSYVLIDGQTNGTRKILISNILKPPEPDYLYNWDFTESLTDSVQGLTAEVKKGATFTVGTGVIINAYSGWLNCKCRAIIVGKTIEVDFSNVSKNFSSDHGRLITSGSVGDSGFIYRSQTDWEVYRQGKGWRAYTLTSQDPNIFSNKTLKMVFLQNEQMKVYADDTLIYEGGSILYDDTDSDPLVIGSREGQNFYNMTITGVRIYANEGV